MTLAILSANMQSQSEHLQNCKEGGMFPHYLAGCLVFWGFGILFGRDITATYLLAGAVAGALPDLLSLVVHPKGVKIDKWSHLHRDNFTHTIFFPLAAYLLIQFYDNKLAITISTAILTHPFLDSFGIGWGVKLFYPLSDVTLKLFYIKGKYFYSPEVIYAHVIKHGNDNWFRDLFLRPTLVAFFEWGSLIATILILIFHL